MSEPGSGEYLADPAVPFYVWLRFLAVQRMQMIQRAHLGAQMRDVSQEVHLPAEGVALASADSMAGQLVSHITSPSLNYPRSVAVASSRLAAAPGARTNRE